MNGTPERMRRGGYLLPHQPQQTMRNLDAETINASLKGSALGYMLTHDEVEARRTGKATGVPHRYLVRHPEMSSLPWRAFDTLEELQAWADAYGLTIARDGTNAGEPVPGRTFAVYLPDERVESYAVVATVEEASARMLELFPVVEPCDGAEVNVTVADLRRYAEDQRRQTSSNTSNHQKHDTKGSIMSRTDRNATTDRDSTTLGKLKQLTTLELAVIEDVVDLLAPA
jgi:hypothetical protein